jgi:hypothetical protein
MLKGRTGDTDAVRNLLNIVIITAKEVLGIQKNRKPTDQKY